MSQGLGIAVIGAGMAGRAHAAAYRTASTLYEPTLPPLRLTAIADINPDFGTAAARRFGYERHESDWQAVAAADDVDLVSVVVANSLHRPIVEGLLAAGKHVLCEKPLSDNVDEAARMARTAAEAGPLARLGFTFRRSPGIAYIRELQSALAEGKQVHL